MFKSRWFSVLVLTLIAVGNLTVAVAAASRATALYIVQATQPRAAAEAVRGVGGRITHELAIIDAVAARLSPAQVAQLEKRPGLTITLDRDAQVAGYAGQPYVARHSGAAQLHASGITGRGVTIAFLDTGIWPNNGVATNTAGSPAILQGYDAIRNVLGVSKALDESGHGTHVMSVATSATRGLDGTYAGIAPDASRIAVKAFDAAGRGSYANVIRGLDWILANRAQFNIRIVNLSFGATPQSFYWNDPLARAVMRLWEAGIVVVASAGNLGPHAQSITVPGNVPYVITVGAMTDNYTPDNPADDRLASFSSTGPTYEGFVKPEIVAPGGHVTGPMNKTNTIPKRYLQFHDNDKFFMMSGTSQAAAVVSGTVALMLQANPSLTLNHVKCKLMNASRPAVDGAGRVAYSVFQQGAGQLNAVDAVSNPNFNCANVGLNVSADLAGTQRFGGPARQAADGSFYIVDASGQPINQQGYLWSAANAWNNGYLWNASFVPSTASVSGINNWVEQQ